MDRQQNIFALHNVTPVTQQIALADINLVNTESWTDLISGQPVGDLHETLDMAPYQVVWLSNRDPKQ
jgi:sucrose phosphorylase